jgi:chitinase
LATATQQFESIISGAVNSQVAWSVREGTAGGSITSNGLYTAPEMPGTYHVVCTSVADPTKSAVAVVTVQ